jgi:hypothetical protein
LLPRRKNHRFSRDYCVLRSKPVKSIIRDFHIMKGDSDPGISAQQTVIESGFAGTCQQALSKISTKIDCTFVPRS